MKPRDRADPIFEAIELHKSSWRCLEFFIDRTDAVLADRQSRSVTAEDAAFFRVADRAEREAMAGLLALEPASAEGALAVMRYLETLGLNGLPEDASLYFENLLLTAPDPVAAD